jgi:hypothetical protein
MHRRDIVRLGLVGGASLSVSALLRAHEPPFRIGALIPGPDNGRFSASLRDGLRDLGWMVLGQARRKEALAIARKSG